MVIQLYYIFEIRFQHDPTQLSSSMTVLLLVLLFCELDSVETEGSGLFKVKK